MIGFQLQLMGQVFLPLEDKTQAIILVIVSMILIVAFVLRDLAASIFYVYNYDKDSVCVFYGSFVVQHLFGIVFSHFCFYSIFVLPYQLKDTEIRMDFFFIYDLFSCNT